MARRPDRDERALAQLLAERARWAYETSAQGGRKLQETERRIRRRFERKVAIFVLDMSGFTRVTIERGILHYLMMIHRMRELCVPAIARHRGTLVKTEADNLFARFPTPKHAVEASLDMFGRLSEANLETDDESDIQVSIGIGWGPTLVLEHDMWGGEFNLASKLGEDIAGAGELLLTEAAHRAMRGGPYDFLRRPLTVAGMPYTGYLLKLLPRRTRSK
jgi:adenylate cyclase